MECRSSIKISLLSAAVIVGIIPDVGWASWTIEPVDLSGEVGWSLNLGIDPMGTPHAAYFTTNPNGDFHYSRRGEAGWQQPSGAAMAIAALTFAALCTSPNPTKVGARSGVD